MYTNNSSITDAPVAQGALTPAKEAYSAPHLTVHGQLQRLTLAPGGSIGGPSTLSTVLDNGTGTGNGN